MVRQRALGPVCNNRMNHRVNFAKSLFPGTPPRVSRRTANHNGFSIARNSVLSISCVQESSYTEFGGGRDSMARRGPPMLQAHVYATYVAADRLCKP
jgi:hypothetical protein